MKADDTSWPVYVILGCLLCALPALSKAGVEASECDIHGESIHWMVDYCMARIGTDDEIAASPCIQEQTQILFRSECGARAHFKRALCALSVGRGGYRGLVTECVDDQEFRGITVRDGGVGS